MSYPLIGILGGTFNPIHYGHLRMAQEAASRLDLKEVKFIPSANPPHKPKPTVTAQQRAEMVALAINDNSIFSLDKCEINRIGPSYTLDTLHALKKELHDVALCLIMGKDAFVRLDSWYEWRRIVDYCHIIVVNRTVDNADITNNAVSRYLDAHYTEDLNDLTASMNGYIYTLVIPSLEISSSYIRTLVSHSKNVNYLTPKEVNSYICLNNLYKPL